MLLTAVADGRRDLHTRCELIAPSASIAAILDALDIDRDWWRSKAVPELQRRWAALDAERAAAAKVARRRERKAAWQRAYDCAHRDEVRSRRRAAYAANPEVPRAKRRAYFVANRAEVLAKQRARRAAGASGEGRPVMGDPAQEVERRLAGTGAARAAAAAEAATTM